jgi:hypothetical protein
LAACTPNRSIVRSASSCTRTGPPMTVPQVMFMLSRRRRTDFCGSGRCRASVVVLARCSDTGGLPLPPVSAGVHCSGLPVKCEYFVENIPTSAVLCSRRRLRPLSTLNPYHSLAAMLACCLNARYLFLPSVVARASAGIGERAGGSRLLDVQRGSARRSHVFSTDQ